MTTHPTQVVLDVDTGVDDALALLFAVRHPALQVRAISCVAGNVGIDAVVRNTLKTLDAAGAGDIPVARGAARPLVAPARDASHVHGTDGLADLGLPESGRVAVDVHAVELMRRAILTSDDPVTLVLLAPTTNAALLLRTHPEVAGNIERVVWMGGSVGPGNATPVAEFNAWHDPEAAAIVLSSGLPTMMYGLDVFHQVAVPASAADAMVASPDAGVRLAGELLQHQAARGDSGGLIGDAGAVCAVVEPAGLVTRTCPVQVELAAGPSRGQTLVDLRDRPGESEVHGTASSHVTASRPVDVALDVDRDHYLKLFLATLTPR